MKILSSLLLIIMFFATHEAAADVYRYISKDGVECYTDAPIHRKSVLIIREPRKLQKTAKKSSEKRFVKAGQNSPDVKNKILATKSRPSALPVNGIISSPVGLRYDPIDGLLRNHKGVDIAVAERTPVKPVAPGVITYSGVRGGYGNIVIIEHDRGMTTVYAHNSINLVSSGDRVDGNTTIALTGSTGRSTGPHLHFEAWLEGQNITAEFLDDPSRAQRVAPRNIAARKKSFIRKIVMADGTILLTNLPLIHP